MDGAEAIRYILKNNIEGVLVECGVGEGVFEVIWINELMKHNQVRDIYLYDTFAGLTKPTEYDYTCDVARHYTMNNEDVQKCWDSHKITDTVNGWCLAPLGKVKETLNATGYPQDKLHYVVGDVMETLKDTTNIPEKIAILRLDTDWYNSSKYELEQMYDNVVSGGVIIFDDYFHWDGQRRATDEFFKSRNISYEVVNLGNFKSGAMIKK